MRGTWNIHFYLNIYCLIINQAWSNNNIYVFIRETLGRSQESSLFTFTRFQQRHRRSFYVYPYTLTKSVPDFFPHIFSCINIIPFTFHPSSSLQRQAEPAEVRVQWFYISHRRRKTSWFFIEFLSLLFVQSIYLTYINRIKDQFSS